MTPTMEAPAAVDSGTSSDALLDQAVSILNDDGSSQETAASDTPGGEEAPPADSPAPPPEQAPPGEGAEGEAPAPPAEGEYQLTEDGQNYLVPKNDLAGIKALREYTNQVQEFFPTAQDAKLASQYSHGMQMLYSDYNLGTDQSIDTLLGYYAGRDAKDMPEVQAQWRQNFQKMADRIPNALKTHLGDDALDAFYDKIVSDQIQRAYQFAAQTGDPIDLKAAQWFDWRWSGQYGNGVQKAQAPDPRQSQLDAREAKLNERDAANLNRDWTNYDKAEVQGKKWSDFYAEVDRALKPFQANYKPGAWPHIRQGVINETLKKMSSDKQWSDLHNSQLDNLRASFEQRWRAGRDTADLKQNAQYYINDFMVRARRHLPSVAKTVLEDAPAKPAAAPAKGVATPPTNGQPVRAANGQFQKPTPAKPGQSQEERRDKLLDSAAKALNW